MISRLDPVTTNWLRRVATDPGLSPRDLQVLILVLPELEHSEFHPIKQLWVAHMVDVCRTTATNALGRLVQNGYLERRDRVGASNEYRLTLVMSAPSHAA